MARDVTVTVLLRQARELADEETATPTVAFIDDTEALGMLNSSHGIWHGLLVKAVPERFETSETITGNGSAAYNLPARHLLTLAVDYQYSTNSFWPLTRIQPQDRTKYETTGDPAEGYYLKAATLVLLPNPSSGTYRHTYIQNAATLTANDSVDGVNGWEQWLVYDVAIRMMIKGKHDPSALIIERDKLKAEIEASAADRDAGTPMRVVDTRLRRY
jgi:hypothetical protein